MVPSTTKMVGAEGIDVDVQETHGERNLAAPKPALRYENPVFRSATR